MSRGLLRTPRSSEEGGILLTGATGFVGMAVLARLLEGTDERVLALVRADTQDEADARLDSVLGSLFEDSRYYADRVEAVAGDLTLPWLGLDLEQRERIAADVDEIIHGAASVAFDLPLAESRAINVEGTRRLLALAKACTVRGTGLRRLTHISTAFVAGDRGGVALEGELDASQGFRNAYEQSKYEAEQLVAGDRDRLPVTVIRPSIVVGERGTGWTSSFNVLYGPLRAYAAGTLRIIPGRRRAVVDVVTVDHLADAIVALSASPAARGRTFHVVGGRHATTLGELSRLASRRFGRREARLVPPRIYRAFVHPLLLRRSKPKVRSRLQRSAVYFPYFSLALRFDDRKARELLDPLGIQSAPFCEHFEELVEFAEAADWGREPIGRAQARARFGRAAVGV